MQTPRPLPPYQIEYKEEAVLRPPFFHDVSAIEEAYRLTSSQLKTFMAWAHFPLIREKLLERILEQHGRYFQGKEYELALFDKKSGDFVTYIGFYPVSRINPLCLEIGFWTSAKYKNRGYATLGTQILIALIFEYFKGDRIEITCNIENEASQKVIEKCGFKCEGELRHYYPKGTAAMFHDGFIKERKANLYSLIPEDRDKLEWYPEILSHTHVYPMQGKPFLLKEKTKNI